MYYPLYYVPYVAVTARQYPPVDPTTFHQSANEMTILMNDASIVLNRLADSTDFAKKVMSAAQESDIEEVKNLIQSTGIKSLVNVKFNPDNIRLEFSSRIKEVECCKLQIAIKWR